MKFLIGLASLIVALGAVSYVRTPAIPDVADSEFSPSGQAPENSRTPESFKELADFLDKERGAIDWIKQGENVFSTKFTAEQSAAVQRASAKIASSGICFSPIRGDGASSRFTVYSASAKTLRHQFVLNFQNGNPGAARKNFDDLVALGGNLSTAKDVGLVGHVVSMTVEGSLLGISEALLSSPEKANYSETVRKFLVSKSKNPASYEEAQLFTAERNSENFEALKKMPSAGISVKLSDADYARRYYRQFAKLNLAGTSMEELRSFASSLPYCPMDLAKYDGEDRGKLLKSIHYRLTCPFDPIRGKMATRLVLAPAYTHMGDLVDDQKKLDELRAKLLAQISTPGTKAGTTKRKNVKK